MDEIDYHWYHFQELSGEKLYAVLKLRQMVFIVEQRCAYQDCDDLDQIAWHLVGWRKTAGKMEPVAYLRVILREGPGEMPVIGRLLVHPELRNQGQGRNLLTLALHHIGKISPQASIRISAQHYLVDFYQSFGFHPVSGVYDEDGIPHIRMIRPPQHNP